MPLVHVCFSALVVALFLVACGASTSTGAPDSPHPTVVDALPTIPPFDSTSIDAAVKDNVEMMAPRPTNEEIGLACLALHRSGWDYLSIDIRTSGRTTSIAAAITTFASGSQLVNYCEGKVGIDATGQMLPCPDVQNRFVNRVVSLYEETGQYPGRIRSIRALTGSFQMKQYVQRRTPSLNGGWEYHINHEVKMDFLMDYGAEGEKKMGMEGSIDVNDCSWIGVGSTIEARTTPSPSGTSGPKAILPSSATPSPSPIASSGGSPGRQIFITGQGEGVATPCVTCHTVAGMPEAVGLLGPDLSHIGTEAAKRQPGVSAEEYIRQSIREPEAFIPEGVDQALPGLMLTELTAGLTETDVNALVEFLLQQK